MLTFATPKLRTHSLWFCHLSLREGTLIQFDKAMRKRFVHPVLPLTALVRFLLARCQRGGSMFSIMLVCCSLSVLLRLSLLLSIHPTEQIIRHQVVYPVSTYTYSAREIQETLAFWTPERMRAAVALEASPNHLQLVSHSEKVMGSLRPGRSTAVRFSSDATNAKLVPKPLYATKLRTVGKLFTTISTSASGKTVLALCTAVALISNNHSVVDAAGHCLYDRDRQSWGQKVMFCPQYDNGNCPVGKWVAQFASVDSAWKTNGNAAQDFGDIAVIPTNKGTLDATVGGSLYQYNGPQFTNEQAFGYPGDLSNGEVMYVCSGTGVVDPGHNPGLAGIPCDMGGGSSGGPWFSQDAKGNVFVNGHNDVSAEGLMFSPHYNSEWFAVFNSAQNAKIPSSSDLVSVHTF